MSIDLNTEQIMRQVFNQGSKSLNISELMTMASLGLIPGVSIINKFGETPGVDTATDPQDIWSAAPDTFAVDGGTYTFPTTASIDSISSSSAADTQTIQVQGQTADYTEVIQTVTLTGQTRAALTTPLMRVYRAKNTSATATAGDIYIYDNTALTAGVPTDKSKIRAKITIDAQQTEMAIYTIPAGKTGLFVTEWASLSRGNVTTSAICTVRTRSVGGVFRVQKRFTLSSAANNSWIYTYDVPTAYAEKTDIKCRVEEVSANNTGVSAGFDLLLFDNTIWGL